MSKKQAGAAEKLDELAPLHVPPANTPCLISLALCDWGVWRDTGEGAA